MSESPDMHCSHRDDVAPFAIGALEDEAVDSFVAHLATCSSCQAEVNDLQGLASMLRSPPSASSRRRSSSIV